MGATLPAGQKAPGVQGCGVARPRGQKAPALQASTTKAVVRVRGAAGAYTLSPLWVAVTLQAPPVAVLLR